MAGELRRAQEEILTANGADLQAAGGPSARSCWTACRLTPERIEGMAAGLESVAACPTPVGQVKKHLQRPNGLVIEKVTAPMGVIAIIYESRPNVTADAAALCLKAGSACVLRGGKEAHPQQRRHRGRSAPRCGRGGL